MFDVVMTTAKRPAGSPQYVFQTLEDYKRKNPKVLYPITLAAGTPDTSWLGSLQDLGPSCGGVLPLPDEYWARCKLRDMNYRVMCNDTRVLRLPLSPGSTGLLHLEDDVEFAPSFCEKLDEAIAEVTANSGTDKFCLAAYCPLMDVDDATMRRGHTYCAYHSYRMFGYQALFISRALVPLMADYLWENGVLAPTVEYNDKLVARLCTERWNADRSVHFYATTPSIVQHVGYHRNTGAPGGFHQSGSYGRAWPNFQYEAIEGWFDFADIYQQAVDEAISGARFVEVGGWLGKSTSYMAAAIRNSGKSVRFDCVDTWGGSDPEHLQDIAKHGDPFARFKANLERARLHHYVLPVRKPSLEAVRLYFDGSLDFVFLDGDHSYEAVAADIAAWKPKVRRGGVLAGHDYYCYERCADVQRAVKKVLGNKFQTRGSSWWCRIEE